MDYTTNSKCRYTFDVSNGKLDRIRSRELNSDGKYVDIARPSRARDLLHAKKVAQAANLLGRGISDLQEVKELVNAPRARRQGAIKSKPTASPAKANSRRRKRRRR